jgi:hypothetical protein
MTADVRIELLSQHPEYLLILKGWFEREWPNYYGIGGPGDAAADLRAYSTADSLPIGIVALNGNKLCGVAALRATSIPRKSISECALTLRSTGRADTRLRSYHRSVGAQVTFNVRPRKHRVRFQHEAST